jgi:hypothetical protein
MLFHERTRLFGLTMTMKTGALVKQAGGKASSRSSQQCHAFWGSIEKSGGSIAGKFCSAKSQNAPFNK